VQPIPNLEIHVSHSCNLACESCSHYSNQGHKGLLDLAEAERWMQAWSARLAPRTFTLLGGEPSIHPQLSEFIPLARNYWPGAHLRLVTNGFFLHRHPDLPRVLRDDPDAKIYLSVHHDAPEYRARLQPIHALLESWVAEYGIQVGYALSFEHWTRRYHGSGAAMQPYADGQPRQSWERCPAATCPQLFEGSIWKCGPLAYLKLQDAKFGLGPAWRPYLDYQPLEASCTDAALREFFAREEEATCNMCAANPERLALPMPLLRHPDGTDAGSAPYLIDTHWKLARVS